MRPMQCLLCVLVLSMGWALAANAEVKQQFDTLFGAEVKRVTATSDPADDVMLAQQLLTAAKGTTDQPEMRDYLCEYAYVLGSRDASGYAVAVEAMQFVAENDPKKATECDTKIQLLYQRGYERSSGEKKTEAGEQYVSYLVTNADARIAAKDYAEAMNLLRKARPVAIAIKSPQKDAVQSKIDAYTTLSIAATRIETAEKKLKANPWDKVTHGQLLDLYLTDMDDPAKASAHLELGGDETQKKLVPLAAKLVGDVDEAQSLALADFYEGLAKKGVPITKAAMLTRAKGYLDQYLNLHTTEDVQRTAATLSLARVTDALAKLELELGGVKKAVVAENKTTMDLLDYVDPARDGQSGRWLRVGESIKAERGGFTEAPRLRAPVRIEGTQYTLKVKFTRDSGEGSVGIVFPVGQSQVSYSMNLFPSRASGLSDLNGQGAGENATRKDVTLTNGKVATVDISVKADEEDAASISISFDGRSVLEWKGKQSELSINNFINPGDPKVVAFVTFGSGITIGSAQLKMISGKAEPFEKIVDKAAKIESLKNAEKETNRDDERRDREKMAEDFIKGRFKGKGRGN